MLHSSIFKGDLPTLKEVCKPRCLHLPSPSFQPALYYELKRAQKVSLLKNNIFRKSTGFQIISLPVFAAASLGVTALAASCQLCWWNFLGFSVSSHPHICTPSSPPASCCRCCLAKQHSEIWVKITLERAGMETGLFLTWIMLETWVRLWPHKLLCWHKWRAANKWSSLYLTLLPKLCLTSPGAI